MQDLQAQQAAAASVRAERDSSLRDAQDKCRELSLECGHRKSCQEALARQLATRDQELTVARIQANNQRLGTVVQRFASGGMDAPRESFEPAFAYHQLQQVRSTSLAGCHTCALAYFLHAPISLQRPPACTAGFFVSWADGVQKKAHLDDQKLLIEAKRKELRAVRNSNAGEPTCAHADDVLKSKLDAIERQRKDLAVEQNKLDIERTKHVREVKLQWDYMNSPYQLHNGSPLLKDQYVLMSMFGKGGFAAVRPAAQHNAVMLHCDWKHACCTHVTSI